MHVRTKSLPASVAGAAEQTVGLLLARAVLFGLPRNASRALEYGCGLGTTTAALADSFGEAVGVEPSPTQVDSARLMHRGRTNVTFVEGGTTALRDLPGTFDFAYADLEHARSGGASPDDVVAALLRVLAPGGLMAVRLPRPRPSERLLSLLRPSRVLLRRVTDTVSAAGGRTLWAGAGDHGSMLFYASSAPRVLRVVGDSHPGAPKLPIARSTRRD